MKTTELEKRVSVETCCGGSFKVRIQYRGKEYKCTSNNTTAYDRMKEGDYISLYRRTFFYTFREALQALYDECKRANDLR